MPEQEQQLMAMPVPPTAFRSLVQTLRESQQLDRIASGLKLRLAQEEFDHEPSR